MAVKTAGCKASEAKRVLLARFARRRGSRIGLIGVQISHPHAVVTSVTTTEWMMRNSLKVLMAASALAGITGRFCAR